MTSVRNATALHLAAASLVVLAGSIALAHVVAFDIVLSRRTGNFPDSAGIFPLQWVDQESRGGMATARLFVTRAAYGPFGAPDANDVIAVSAPIPLSSPVNVADWDTRDAGAGCWQPYAVIDDPVEGQLVSLAEGRVTVGGAPAIWVMTPAAAQPDDAGRLLLTWEMDSSLDSAVAIEWQTFDGVRGTAAARLPLSAGTRTASYGVDVSLLPARATFLQLTLTSDAGTCDAWWRGYVIRAVVDAGQPDGGMSSDGGAADAGAPDAGRPADGGAADAGGDLRRGGCGCDSGSAPLLLLLAVLALRRRM